MLRLFKFVVPNDQPLVTAPPGVVEPQPGETFAWAGCLIVVLASDEETALELAVEQSPYDEPWLRCVKPVELDLTSPQLVALARLD